MKERRVVKKRQERNILNMICQSSGYCKRDADICLGSIRTLSRRGDQYDKANAQYTIDKMKYDR